MRSTFSFIGGRRTLEKLVGKHGGGRRFPGSTQEGPANKNSKNLRGLSARVSAERGGDSEGKETTRTLMKQKKGSRNLAQGEDDLGDQGLYCIWHQKAYETGKV